MISLPEEYELIGFFESEPTLASPETPWCYNNLRFAMTRGADKLVCEIEPAYGEMRLVWEQEGLPRANIKLNTLGSISVHMGRDDEHMIVTGTGPEPITMLKLRLKPFVSIEMSCWHESR